jgi:hypothetical protein
VFLCGKWSCKSHIIQKILARCPLAWKKTYIRMQFVLWWWALVFSDHTWQFSLGGGRRMWIALDLEGLVSRPSDLPNSQHMQQGGWPLRMNPIPAIGLLLFFYHNHKRMGFDPYLEGWELWPLYLWDNVRHFPCPQSSLVWIFHSDTVTRYPKTPSAMIVACLQAPRVTHSQTIDPLSMCVLLKVL